MVSVTTTASASSSTSLRPTPSSSFTSMEDYSAAFGALQTQYGWGPVTSVPVRSTQVTEAQERSQPKDYESAFGALSSKLGFGRSWTPSAGCSGLQGTTRGRDDDEVAESC
ncbi:hypothetical protein K466DRAFT_590778 [Polyporus arcularius HHB13444]|uniref:Uncharacterized protein n=1 Tax=Polyporus arcularius HHB13444 TaxID=1314778 RepID=A0A5C3NZY6_9APHY|nr:hypothetical protein K466DRAFT_590778 [Polyporus arcularius HHB13444]